MGQRISGGPFISSLLGHGRYEDDQDFRTEIRESVNRGVGILGASGLAVLTLYLLAQVILLDKTVVLTYEGQPVATSTVIWDKIVTVVACLAACYLGFVRRPADPFPGRLTVFAAALIVAAVMVLDDVAAGDVTFSSAYVALVLLVTVAVVPFKPLHSAALSIAMVVVWFCSIKLAPPFIGLESGQTATNQIVFLGIIVVLSTVISASLYESRYLQFRSLRESKKLVAELESAMLSLTRTQARLIHAEKMASLGRFVSGVAHELRNPLNFVANFARMSHDLADEFATGGEDALEVIDDLKANLIRIQKHADRANNVVTELMSHTDESSAAAQRVDLNKLVATQVRVVESTHSAQDRQIEIVEQFDERIGQIEVYPAALSRAIRNVLDNAFQATAGQDVEPEIRVSTNAGVDAVEIAISDNGRGLEPEISNQVFEPFFTRWNDGLHTGLGLTAAYDIVTDGHGGSIGIKSAAGEGTRVVISVPTGRSVQLDPDRA